MFDGPVMQIRMSFITQETEPAQRPLEFFKGKEGRRDQGGCQSRHFPILSLLVLALICALQEHQLVHIVSLYVNRMCPGLAILL
jgi:hypothetical protein